MTETLHAQRPDGSGDLPLVDVSADEPTDTPTLRMMELARQYGPAFVRRLHGGDLLMISDLDLVTELADEQRFTKAVGPSLENVREFAGDGLFTAYNEEPNWAKAHDILMPAFALGSMRTYHPAMLQVARRLIGSWDGRAAAGERVDVAGDMTRMTLDTIGLAGFGFDFHSFDGEQPHPFVESMVRCLEWAMAKATQDPGLDHSASDRAMRTDADYLASVVDEVIAARTAERAAERATGAATSAGPVANEERVPRDLLDLMLDVKHPADGTGLDLENVRNQVITFLIAGHETTSGTLAFALYHLAKHPAVLRRLRREVDELWGDTPDPAPTFEEVGRLPYTRQVLNETLRLWPTAPSFAREARQDTLLGNRIPLRAGQPVLVLSTMLHRESAWGDNPELFDPERFAPEAVAARSPHAFKPFGTGERACIGRQFALHEATMLLAMLVHRYRLIDQDGYQLTLKQSLTIKPNGFTLTLLPRTPADRAADRAATPFAAATPSAATPSTGTPSTGTPSATAAQGASASGAAAAELPTRVRQGTGVLLLHGSNYGTCRDFAARLADTAAELGCETTLAPLDAYRAALPTDRPVVIVAASYNGRPTDDAAGFVRWLEEAGPGAAAGVHYALLGVGDRNWAATYQRVPTLIDDRLTALGATRLMPRGEADASGELGAVVETFSAALAAVLLTRHGDAATVGRPAEREQTPAYTVTEVTGGARAALAARHGLTELTVLTTADLTRPGYPRVKRLVRLALPEGVAYRAGDHLTVLPANSPALVERAVRLLRVDPDTVLRITANRARRDGLGVDRPLTVRELLTHYVELQDRPTAGQLALLAAANPCPPEQAALRVLAEDAVARTEDRRTVLDLIEDHAALRETLDWPTLLELLAPIRPRHYSISSTPVVQPGQVDLMVSVLRAPARSGRGTFHGTGSGHLATRAPGDTVLARLQPCREDFRIDHRADAPVIMIAAGTGLAPFRAAVAERHALLADGVRLATALCYFGCDAPDADFLHADELRAAERAGAVSLRPVFSDAAEEGCRYVQHRIAAEADQVWELLRAGARVYVCGDGARMAPGVREAFQDMYLKHTPQADRAMAGEWLRALVDQGRYVEDVYGG